MTEIANNPPRSNRRRFFQFSLRTFLIVFTLFGVWLGLQVRNAQRQKDAVKAILEAGGIVRYDYEQQGYGREVRDPRGDVIKVPCSPEWLRNLIGQDYFVNVTTVAFMDVALTDDQLVAIGRQLEGLPKLRVLSIWNSTTLTDEGLRGLAELTQRRELILNGIRHLTGNAFHHLRGLTRLRWLECEATPVDDEGLSNLCGMRELEFLDLNLTRITDQGLSRLENLNSLKRLKLSYNAISDAGVKALARHTNLTQLELSETQITDGAIPILTSFIKMNDLDVRQTGITPEGSRILQNSFPNAFFTKPDGNTVSPRLQSSSF